MAKLTKTERETAEEIFNVQNMNQVRCSVCNYHGLELEPDRVTIGGIKMFMTTCPCCGHVKFHKL